MFEADEVLRILDAADGVIRAMTLLGINGGFGNTDVANLPQSAIDFDGGWMEFPRPKTEICRRVPLWPETSAALQQAIATRPKAKHADVHVRQHDPEDDCGRRPWRIAGRELHQVSVLRPQRCSFAVK